jgi:hypothetical protein
MKMNWLLNNILLLSDYNNLKRTQCEPGLEVNRIYKKTFNFLGESHCKTRSILNNKLIVVTFYLIKLSFIRKYITTRYFGFDILLTIQTNFSHDY